MPKPGAHGAGDEAGAGGGDEGEGATGMVMTWAWAPESMTTSTE